MENEKKYRLGIALGGGGAKGFAHLGVLRALEEFGLKPDIIAGCSAGSELIHAKLQGFAVDREEIEAGLICVGAPIFDINHRAVAAISISGPNYRMQADWETMVREVRKTAEKISTLLGYKFMR